jgi:drug/metabolite transporter (DMT)-like permease
MTGEAILLSVIAALFVAVGSALQHQGVGDTEAPQGGVALVIRLLKNKPWMAGLIITGLSTVLHAAALKDGTLAVVETVMAINLAMALPVRALLDRAKPSIGQSIAALVLTVGVAIFVTAANPTAGNMRTNGSGAVVMILAGIVFALVCIAIAARTRKERIAGVTLGLAGGVLYGLGGGALKTTVAEITHNPVGALFNWPLWVVIGLNAWAFVIHQEAYARAPLRASLPALSVSNPIAGIIFGALVFDEIPGHSPLDIVAELLGLAVILGSIMALAQRDPGRHRRQPSLFEGLTLESLGVTGNRTPGTRRAVKVKVPRNIGGKRRKTQGQRRQPQQAPGWRPDPRPVGYAAAPLSAPVAAPMHPTSGAGPYSVTDGQWHPGQTQHQTQAPMGLQGPGAGPRRG